MQQTAQQLHQQNAALKLQLERQSLQNQLLQRTMENDALRKQLSPASPSSPGPGPLASPPGAMAKRPTIVNGAGEEPISLFA